ncbi:hypothetical protein N1851_014005 [Merluccius polli]|uniref:Endonuclease/exonuclease/phosphatase domain-containing protein n=1 Tax=Merluccius polli TaxID=89951 RepID=A0AA47MV11_MERPO|nr:hypothetical protein N1851_014005 [Merluccius polli]
MECQQKGCPQAPRNGSDTTEFYSSGCHRLPFDLPLVQHRDTTLRLFSLASSLAYSPLSVAAVVHEAHWGQVILGRYEIDAVANLWQDLVVAGSSVTVAFSFNRTQASTINSRAPTWVHDSATPAMHVQWAKHTCPDGIRMTHGSLRNKVDELRACSQYLSDYRQSCLICLTESWLTEADPDSSIDLEGFTLVRMDRNQNSGKKRGGADTQAAATLLHELVSQAETEAPDAANLIMGDFNLCSLKEHLPTYQQYVTCSTRD